MIDVKTAITGRRSIRKYTHQKVDEKKILEILEAGRWAPSGRNIQPWRFIVITKRDLLGKLNKLLPKQRRYSEIFNDAQAAIAVFMDNNVMYDSTKDTLAIGACIQNMLLRAYEMGIGTCWVGEILSKKEEVREILKAPPSYELVSIITLGYPDEKPRSARKSLKDIAFKNEYDITLHASHRTSCILSLCLSHIVETVKAKLPRYLRYQLSCLCRLLPLKTLTVC